MSGFQGSLHELDAVFEFDRPVDDPEVLATDPVGKELRLCHDLDLCQPQIRAFFRILAFFQAVLVF